MGARATWPALTRLAAVLVLLSGAGFVQAGADDARTWIQRMNEAVVKRNYDGVFRLRFGDRVDVMRIVHRYQDGEMIERVISTDGSGYEQKRKGSRWAEFRPDKRRVDTATRNRSFGFLPTLNGIDPVSARHYDIQDGGAVSLDGREVRLIQVLPKDALRFGYRFWLDEESALPMKLQRVAHDGRVLKEVAFINQPRLPETIADDRLMVELDFKGFTWVDRDRFTPMHNAQLKRAYAPQGALLPAGYRSRIFNSPAQEARAPGHRARFIVSDGVSWAEVFIAPVVQPARAPAGFSAGPLASYQLVLDDAQVTVVGEMPEAAARAIAEAVRPE